MRLKSKTRLFDQALCISCLSKVHGTPLPQGIYRCMTQTLRSEHGRRYGTRQMTKTVCLLIQIGHIGVLARC